MDINTKNKRDKIISEVTSDSLDALARNCSTLKHYKLLSGLKLLLSGVPDSILIKLCREIYDSLDSGKDCIVQFKGTNRLIVIPTNSTTEIEAPYICLGISLDTEDCARPSAEDSNIDVDILIVEPGTYTPTLRINKGTDLKPIDIGYIPAIGRGYRSAKLG